MATLSIGETGQLLRGHIKFKDENTLSDEYFTGIRPKHLFNNPPSSIFFWKIEHIDELLKWAELKEKGLVTDEEFQKAKEKILEGKL